MRVLLAFLFATAAVWANDDDDDRRHHDDDDDDDDFHCNPLKVIESWQKFVQTSNVGGIVGSYEEDATLIGQANGKATNLQGRDVELLNYYSAQYAAGGLMDPATTWSITYGALKQAKNVFMLSWTGSFESSTVTGGTETFVVNKRCRIASQTTLQMGAPAPTPASALTLCEKWASESKIFNGDQLKMMTAVVTGVFGDEIASSLGRPFFDGSVPCMSRNFINNTANQNELVNSLVAFFGQPGVLGCNQTNFPAYTGNPDMGAVHMNMPITQAVFDLFVSSLVNVVTGALSADVPSLSSDISAVAALLNSPGVAVICNQPDCTKQPTNGVSVYVPKVCSSTTSANAATSTVAPATTIM